MLQVGFNTLLFIFLGGGLGSVLRHFSASKAADLFGMALPYGTLCVNVLGSFIIGVLAETISTPETRAFLLTGFLGGFTTFSAFSLDFFKLAETGQMTLALFYAGLSVVLSLLAVFGGVFLARGVL